VEKNYSTTEREALAIVWAINKFRGYIEETSVVVITDHQPLRWLMTLKSPTGRLARWALQLQPYNLSIEYTPGRANALADMLSRPAMPEENAELSSALRSLEIELPRRNELEIRTEQLKDPDLKKIIDALTNATPEVAQPWLNRGYLLNSGVLYRYFQDNDEEAAQLLVPDHERTRVLKQYHDSPTAGHYGIERTYHRIQQRYYWPGMRRYIECRFSRPLSIGLLFSGLCRGRLDCWVADVSIAMLLSSSELVNKLSRYIADYLKTCHECQC
jgi:hypothetical protein